MCTLRSINSNLMFLFSAKLIYLDYSVRVSFLIAKSYQFTKSKNCYFMHWLVVVLSTTSFTPPAFTASEFVVCKFLHNQQVRSTICLPLIIHSNAATTFELSRADVSSNAIYSFSAKTPASSYYTCLSFSKSDLFPISIKTMFSAP